MIKVIKMRRTHLGVYGIAIYDDKVLLIKKAEGPYIGLLDLPGGGLEFGETPEQTLVREFREEAGLDITDYKLSFCDSLCFWHNATRDKATVELHHIGIFYEIAVESLVDVKTEPDGLDSDGALWFDLANGDRNMLAPFVKMAISKLTLSL